MKFKVIKNDDNIRFEIYEKDLIGYANLEKDTIY